MSLRRHTRDMLRRMEQEFAHAPGTLLHAWQLLSMSSAVLVLCAIASGLTWRLRVEARVVESCQEKPIAPVLRRLQVSQADELEAGESVKGKGGCLASFTKPTTDPVRRVANGD